MSFWIHKKNKEGKKELFTVTIPIELIMIAIALIAALFAPRYMDKPEKVVSDFIFILIIGGFILFSVSKVSLFRKGIWNSWGSKLMDKPYRILYRVGYILMGMGIGIAILLVK